MGKVSWHPGTLLQTSGSYWQACTLHAGVKLDIFSALERSAQRAKQLSAGMGVDERGLTMLLNALTAMDLLVKTKYQFDLTDAARRFLVKSSPHYIGHRHRISFHRFPLMGSNIYWTRGAARVPTLSIFASTIPS